MQVELVQIRFKNFLIVNNVKITLVNLDDYKTENSNIFTCIKGDACALDFKDNEFDFSFSNSVIEHVGDYENMIKFASEMKRVSKFFYCQTTLINLIRMFIPFIET